MLKKEYKLLIVNLGIKSYVGYSFGAVHSYGTLKGYGPDGAEKTVEVERPMTAKEAAYLNKDDIVRHTYKAGSITSRLTDRRDVVDTALKMWRAHFPDAVVLIERQTWTSNPGLILNKIDGFDREVSLLNTLYFEYDEMLDAAQEDDDLFEEVADIQDDWDDSLDSLLANFPVPQATEPTADPEPEPAIEDEPVHELMTPDRKKEEPKPDKVDWYETHEYEEMTLPLRCRTTMAEKKDGGGKEGFVEFYMSQCTVSNDHGEVIGYVRAGTSSSIWISRVGDDRHWRIGADDIWHTFVEALEAHDEEKENAK